ncbi:MAG: asparagine synthase (glutamine-hydrolyzing) [Bacillota bacterium]|nr:asparagine synthase (glutamine-hydrolyzing) [Bacillota bacterium]
MCGITGWVDWEQELEGEEAGAVLEAMTATLASRGPDAAGTWVAGHAALGHRRLVVVDPAGGGQPMVRRRGEQTFVLVYNGELYNTSDLRAELTAKGYAFQGHSDTEVLLLSFMEWGPECVDRLNGIFAFAVWDAAAQSLFAARDRLGVKPLFYAERGRAFLFGSELKALLAHPAVEPVVDAEGLAELFVLGPSRTPGHGVFRGVRELRPGHCLIFDRNGLRLRRYWGLESRPHEDDLDTTAGRVRELLEDTVKRQLVSDVPVCTLLSGGLDSSAVTAFAAKAYARDGLGPLDTYSVDYVNNALYFQPTYFQPDSDAPWVKKVSEFLGTRHHNVVLENEQVIAALTDATLARDLPGMADVDSSLYLFCREVKRGATVALSGESADEIFGGYPWFHSEKALAYDSFPWLRATGQRAALLAPELREWARPVAYVAERYQESLAEVPRLPGEDPLEARRREISYLNLTWFLATLLDRKDRMSMASGLEVRVPYCDHRLVEYVWNIPWEFKNCDGQRKGILRRALAGTLPDDVLHRPKSPYPKTHHPGYLSAVQGWLAEILDDPASPLHNFIDGPRVRALVQSGGEGLPLSWYGQLMGGAQLFAYLIQLDTFLRRFNVRVAGR